MPLIAQAFASKFKAFIINLNGVTQKDRDAAITAFCNELENEVYTAIKSLTITIPSGTIVVTGANSGGPVEAVNLEPITLTKPMIS